MITSLDLIQAARAAQKHAYAPYSGFQVGAALLTADGTLYTGTNVENASYGLTVCAERIAIFKAVSDGRRELAVMAITGSGRGKIIPCGACLQVMAEFCPALILLLTDEQDQYEEIRLQELLPMQFSL